MNNSVWTNGSWTIEWENEDELKITGPYNHECILCGGDFESVLSGIAAAYSTGKQRQKKEAADVS